MNKKEKKERAKQRCAERHTRTAQIQELAARQAENYKHLVQLSPKLFKAIEEYLEAAFPPAEVEKVPAAITSAFNKFPRTDAMRKRLGIPVNRRWVEPDLLHRKRTLEIEVMPVDFQVCIDDNGKDEIAVVHLTKINEDLDPKADTLWYVEAVVTTNIGSCQLNGCMVSAQKGSVK